MCIHDFPTFVDDKVTAQDTHVFFSVVRLLAPHAVPFGYGMIFIHKQGKGQVIFGLETLVTGHAIRADTQDKGILFFDHRVIVAKAARLSGAARSIILRIEI
jgi:hypothetical protein